MRTVHYTAYLYSPTDPNATQGLEETCVTRYDTEREILAFLYQRAARIFTDQKALTWGPNHSRIGIQIISSEPYKLRRWDSKI